MEQVDWEPQDTSDCDNSVTDSVDSIHDDLDAQEVSESEVSITQTAVSQPDTYYNFYSDDSDSEEFLTDEELGKNKEVDWDPIE